MTAQSSNTKISRKSLSRALLLSLAGAVLLVLLAIVLRRRPINVEIFHRIQHLSSAWPDDLWSALTLLGTGSAAYALLTPALLFGRVRWLAAVLFALPLATLATHGPKNLIVSERPAQILSGDAIHVVGEVLRHSSFPSGHSLTAFACAAVVMLLVEPRWRAALAVLPLATLVALSRIAVGAHWPADVLAGIGLGWLCGVFGVWLSMRWRGWNTLTGVRIIALVLAANALYLMFGQFGYPLAQPLQYVLAGIALMCSLWAVLHPRMELSK